MANWTLDDILSKNLTVAGGAGKLIDAKPKDKKKKLKYGNKKTTVDGIVFDSKKEAERYQDLILAMKYKKISALQLQIKFPLIVNDQIVANYIADFVYLDESGKKIVEDVKSEITRKNPVYRLKLKLMKAIYGIEIKES
jgi:hypothetical protein